MTKVATKTAKRSKPRRVRKNPTIRTPRPGAEPTPVKAPIKKVHGAPGPVPGATPVAVVVAERTTPRTGRIRPVSPYSKEVVLARLDIRTREGRMVKKFRNDLADYVRNIRGDINVITAVLIERATMLHLRVRLLDDRFLATGEASEADHRYYLAYVNSLIALLLRMIPKDGMEVLPPPPPSLADYLQAAARRAGFGDDDERDGAVVTLDAADDADPV